MTDRTEIFDITERLVIANALDERLKKLSQIIDKIEIKISNASSEEYKTYWQNRLIEKLREFDTIAILLKAFEF